MNNKYIIFTILLFTLILLGLITYAGREDLKYNPIIQNFEFQNPVCIGLDNDKNLYLIDKKFSRLSKIDYNGVLIYSIKASSKKKKEDAYFSEISVDSNGNIYTLRIFYDIEKQTINYEEIIKINSAGKVEKVLYRIEHKDDKNTFDSKFFALEIKDKYLYFDVRYEDRIEFYKVSINGGKEEKIFEIPGGKDKYYYLAGIEPGKIYMSNYSGDKLYKFTEQKELIELKTILESKNIPEYVLIDKIIKNKNDDLLFIDLFNQCIYKKNNKENLSLYLTKDNLKDKKINFDRVLFKDLWVNDNNYLAIIEQINNIAIIIDNNKNIDKIFTNAKFKIIDRVFKILIWLIFIIFIVLFFYTLYYFLFQILTLIPIILKLIVVFIPILIATIVFISSLIFNKMYERYIEEIFNRLGVFAQIGEKVLSGDEIEKINRPADYLGDYYNKIQKDLQTILNEGKDRWNQSIYAKINKFYNNMFYTMVDNETSFGVLYPLIYAPPAYYEAYMKNELKLVEYTDAEATYLESVIPIKNSEGKTTGLLCLGFSKDEFQKLHTIFISDLVKGIIGATIIFIVVISATSFFILFTINKLHKAVNRMSEGDWNVQVKIKSRDEIAELGKGFNLMCKYIKNYINEITQLNRSYFRFVPKEFLSFLNKTNIIDVQLGNQIETNLSILFSDIRSFTTISEALSPQENFNFINSYLKHIGPIIRKNHGFIDKYIGDAIMALFSEDADNSLNAAIEMQQELHIFNNENLKKGFKPIKIGIGIHYGKVILGVLGEEERMQSTVISDAVNTASRLESITKNYGSKIIVSEEIISNLLNPQKYIYRYIDSVLVKGKTKRVKIYEVLNADDPEIVELKLKTKKDFEDAVTLYYENKFDESLNLFKNIYSQNKKDGASEYFIKIIEERNNFIKNITSKIE